jgi:hypothetical protein
MPIEKVKRGALSKKEREFIERNHHKMSAELIATNIRRQVEQIRTYIMALGGERPAIANTLQEELRRRPEWKNFKEQFTEDELDFFLYRYVQLMNQFGRDDVLPTEEMQIFQVVTLDILTQRVLREQKTALTTVEAASKRIDQLQKDYVKTKDTNLLQDVAVMESTFADARKIVQNCTRQHESYAARQAKTFEDLKALRDQRVKVVEGGKTSYVQILKELQQEEVRKRTGAHMELVKLAVAKEQRRLEAPYKFADGITDNPLLTPTSVLGQGEDTTEGEVPTTNTKEDDDE